MYISYCLTDDYGGGGSSIRNLSSQIRISFDLINFDE